MYYKMSLEPLLTVHQIYTVVRKTVWKCADKRNILVFILDGSCYFEYDGSKFIARKGDAVYIPAGMPYVRYPNGDESVHCCYVHFTSSKIGELSDGEVREEIFSFIENQRELTRSGLQSQSPSVYLRYKMSFAKEYEWIYNRLTRMITSGYTDIGYYNQANLSISMSEVLIRVSQLLITDLDYSNISAGASYPAPLQKSLIFIKKNYRDKISVNDLALLSGVSAQHLIRTFRKHLNTTPIDYVNKMRILYAIDMLRNTEMTIKEIAYDLGFDNPNYFSRLFKKQEGISPVQMRARISLNK